MPSAELLEWAAFERVWGPMLVHERVDIGLAQVCLVLARLFSQKKTLHLRDFLPGWWDTQQSDEELLSRAKQILEVGHADDQHARR